MTDPIIFLDFDGVLNSERWFSNKKQGSVVVPHTLQDKGLGRAFSDLDPVSVRRVARLAKDTGSKIVISSAWRLYFSLPKIRLLLHAHGLPASTIIGITPDLSLQDSRYRAKPYSRGEEIATWRKSRSHTGHFVVLDDTADMEDVWDNFVQTSVHKGVQPSDLVKARKILKGNTDD